MVAVVKDNFRVGTRKRSWSTSTLHVSLPDVLGVQLLVEEQPSATFHATSVPGEKQCYNYVLGN